MKSYRSFENLLPLEGLEGFANGAGELPSCRKAAGSAIIILRLQNLQKGGTVKYVSYIGKDWDHSGEKFLWRAAHSAYQQRGGGKAS